MKILVAEDEAVSRQMLKSILPMWGYEVISVSDGHAAWSELQKPDPPKLVVLDWMMPGLDGLELTRRVRERMVDHYVYILLLTARDSRDDVVAGLDAGADDYLTKPFDPHELRGRVNTARRSLGVQDQLERLANELARKNERLAEITETAHRFVDNVSHEFRTPLAVIKEFASIIHDGLGGPVTGEQQEYLQTITNAVHDLAQMVDDLLDSSKLKSGTLRIERARHTIAEIVDAAAPMIAARTRAKQIQLKLELPDDLPVVFADREKAGRILVNLLVNAIKFSPEGSQIRLWARPDDDAVEIGVTDQGRG